MNAILLSFGKSVEGVALFNAIRDYADELGVPQKTLLMMGLHEFMLVNRDMDFVDKIEKYQEYDGRRKTV